MLTELDEKLWAAAIDRVTVILDDRLVFRYKDRTEIVGQGKFPWFARIWHEDTLVWLYHMKLNIERNITINETVP